MKGLANKTFFRFLFGFIAIIASSFIVISAVGYFSDVQSTAAVAEKVCEAEGTEC